MTNFKILQSLSQLKLAILLLLVIAAFSILGTIIEQDQMEEYYRSKYSNLYILNQFRLDSILLFFGINHIYKTWWFLGLLFLFSVCLISCTYTQQFPTLKIARRCNFKWEVINFKNQEYKTILEKSYFSKCLLNLKTKNYNIFQQKKTSYIYKGILGRFAPIVVHVAMLLILAGNTLGAFGSFNSQELIVKGEIFQIQNTVSKNFLSQIPDYPIRVNDFWIEYGKRKNIQQFYSDLSLLNNDGNEIRRKTISVNFPLQYNNLTLYQTDWNINGLRIRTHNQNYQLPIFSLSASKNVWISWIPEKNGITFITNNLSGIFSLYSNDGNFLGNFNLNEKNLDEIDINFFELISETGLQIKADPGIATIYFGFGILIISSLISYFSFSQFWLTKKKKFTNFWGKNQ